MVAISFFILALVEGGNSVVTLFSPENWLFNERASPAWAIYMGRTCATDPVITVCSIQEQKRYRWPVGTGFLGGVAYVRRYLFHPLFAQGRWA